MPRVCTIFYHNYDITIVAFLLCSVVAMRIQMSSAAKRNLLYQLNM